MLTKQFSNLGSYNLVILNSRYTYDWYNEFISSAVAKMKDLAMPTPHRLVVYPPVTLLEPEADLHDVSKTMRAASIILTGRFFDDVQGKKHLEAITAFEKLQTLSLLNPDTTRRPKLYLVGHQMPGEKHEAYTAKVKERAAKVGNVQVITNMGGAEMISLMKQVSVVWSFTGGLDSDPKHNPADSEHFGIAVVEAMSTGAIPVLVDRGGLREIVNGDPAHLSSTFDDFAFKTHRYVECASLQTFALVNAAASPTQPPPRTPQVSVQRVCGRAGEREVEITQAGREVHRRRI